MALPFNSIIYAHGLRFLLVCISGFKGPKFLWYSNRICNNFNYFQIADIGKLSVAGNLLNLGLISEHITVLAEARILYKSQPVRILYLIG
jgi:hypothetical protein